MPLAPELLAAYENADYVVFTEPQLVLRVGERSARLDALLESRGATTAAFITAANPQGRRRGAIKNEFATAALHELIDASGYPGYAGEGRDPDGRWPAEPSVLVIGIYRDNAEKLGRLFQQNAIVFIEKGRPPELVALVGSEPGF
jgi:hypothetical protein